MPDVQSLEMAVFRRKARQAAHQCLYFLDLLDREQRHQDDPASFLERTLRRFDWALAADALDEYRAFSQRQMLAIVRAIRTPDASPGDPLVARWNALDGKLGGPGLEAADVAPLIESVGELLDVSAPTAPMEIFDSILRQSLLSHLRNLTLIVASVGVWAVFFRVEAVRSLVWNAGFGHVVKSWSPFAAAVIVPLVSLLRRKTLSEIAALGRAISWRIRHQARPPEPGIARWPAGQRRVEQAIFARQFVRLAGALAFVTLVGAAMYVRSAPTTLTIFLVATICLLALIVAHGLDTWDYLESIPLRFLALMSLLVLAGFSSESFLYRVITGVGVAIFSAQNLAKYGATTPREPARLVSGLLLAAFSLVVFLDLVSATLAFLVAMIGFTVWRIQVLFDPTRRALSNVVLAGLSLYFVVYPLVSSIHENRSVWHENATIAPRIALGEWPLAGDEGPIVIMAASGGGSRAAIYTAFTLERLTHDAPDVANHLQAISSVSGGSLASAAYVSRRYNFGPRWTDHLPDDVVAGELVSAVSEDFLLPTLRGALSPLSTRGESIEETWRDGRAMLRQQERVGARGASVDADQDLTITDLKVRWDRAFRAHEMPPFPIPLFNTCTLDQHDVVITPLSAAYYTRYTDGEIPDQLRAAAELGQGDWLTWVADRDAIYGLDTLLPRFDASLPNAVHASANFPFGFPLVALKTKADRNWYQDPSLRSRSDTKLTDGGVLSNSGLWPLWSLLTEPTRAAELQRRGVLLLIVEASKMPEYSADRRDITTLYGDLNNRNPVAQALHRRVLEGLALRLGGALTIEEIDVIPRAGVRSANVMTTWALDSESQQTLAESFRAVWKRERPRIASAWSCLRGPASTRKACLDGRADPVHDLVALRPPLD